MSSYKQSDEELKWIRSTLFFIFKTHWNPFFLHFYEIASVNSSSSHTLSPWSLFSNLHILTLDILVIFGMNHPVSDMLYYELKIQRLTALFSTNQQWEKIDGYGIECCHGWGFFYCWMLMLGDTVVEGLWKEWMLWILLPPNCHIFVIYFVGCLIKRQWCWIASCHCAQNAMHSDEML